MGVGTTVDVVKSGLVDLLRALPELAGVQVEDGYPQPAEIEVEGLVVGDAEGTETPATMRAPAGTRDEVYEVEVVSWRRERLDDRRDARARAVELGNIVRELAYAVCADPRAAFPTVYVRQLQPRSWRLQELPVDLGREAQLIQRIEVRARLSP